MKHVLHVFATFAPGGPQVRAAQLLARGPHVFGAVEALRRMVGRRRWRRLVANSIIGRRVVTHGAVVHRGMIHRRCGLWRCVVGVVHWRLLLW